LIAVFRVFEVSPIDEDKPWLDSSVPANHRRIAPPALLGLAKTHQRNPPVSHPIHIPKFKKKLPQVYSGEELTAFFASLKDEHFRMTFESLLKTRLREQEAVFLFWENIDLTRGVLQVRSKPELGFKIKDAEECNIPVASDLVTRLRACRQKHPKARLVTGTISDRWVPWQRP
jgi:integrase